MGPSDGKEGFYLNKYKLRWFISDFSHIFIRLVLLTFTHNPEITSCRQTLTFTKRTITSLPNLSISILPCAL